MSRKRPAAFAAAALAGLTGVLGAAAPAMAAMSFSNLSPGNWWLPKPISGLATSVDDLFALVLWICFGLSVVVFGVLIYSMVRWRVPADSPIVDGPPIHGHDPLEVTWTIIPFILVGIILYASWGVQQKFDHAPAGSPTVAVEGYQWGWRFSHDGIKEDGVLHIPVGQSVKISLTSPDVIHSFFVPDMRVKQDVVPGMTQWAWLEADKPGNYLIVCAEYCGAGHAYMRGEIIAMPKDQYQKWLASQQSSK